jgi:hypothetical protein
LNSNQLADQWVTLDEARRIAANIAKLPVLKLESRGYDQSQYGLVLLRPGRKSAFGSKANITI